MSEPIQPVPTPNPTDPRDGQPSLAVPPSPAKRCGCHMEPVMDDRNEESDLCSEATGMNDGHGWVIEYCLTHNAAPTMLKALRKVLAERESGARLNCWDEVEAAIKEGGGGA